MALLRRYLSGRNICSRSAKAFALVFTALLLLNLNSSLASSEVVQGGETQNQVDLVTGEVYQPLSAEERAFLVRVVNDPDSEEILPVDLVKRSEIEYRNKLYGTYYQELIDLGCIDKNNLKAGGVWLYDWDNLDEDGVFGGSDIVFKNMVDKDVMFNYLLTNEGEPVYDTGSGSRIVLIDEDLYVYETSNGGKILLPEFSEKIMKGFGEMIKYFGNNGVENIDDFLIDNGVYVISAIAFDGSDKGAAGFYGREGFFCLNFDKNNLGGKNDVGIRNTFISNIPPETMGIRHDFFLASCLDTNLRFSNFTEIGKSLDAGYNFLYLSKLLSSDKYKLYGDFLISLAGDFAEQLNTTIDDPDILHQIKLTVESDYITFMGVKNGDFLVETSDGLIQIK